MAASPLRFATPSGSLALLALLLGSPAPAQDAVERAQSHGAVPVTRPEQEKTAHDRSDVFAPPSAPSSSRALPEQPDEGKLVGFDFARDPLGAAKPGQPAEEIAKTLKAGKRGVMDAQRALLAVQDLPEALGELVGRAVQVVALLELADLLAQLVDHLLEAHHAHVEAAELEPVLAHPVEGLVDVHALHEEARQRVEGALGVEAELLLGPVPAAVAVELHPRA